MERGYVERFEDSFNKLAKWMYMWMNDCVQIYLNLWYWFDLKVNLNICCEYNLLWVDVNNKQLDT